MSPKVLESGPYIFWFHSCDARFENRASIHIGRSSQDDENDAKVWLEPEVELARSGRRLRKHELKTALAIVEENRTFFLEEWYAYKRRAG
ncbi:MAG: DUF4160 domain-containing protein [Caldilineaceae bacterium]|nr:DUF4160 domain-containing protein [Caldilineaceae bacterium]HRJ41330.1 DUF4160 domain-containing protein [Caldilineaceae bacterium]